MFVHIANLSIKARSHIWLIQTIETAICQTPQAFNARACRPPDRGIRRWLSQAVAAASDSSRALTSYPLLVSAQSQQELRP